jgi:hypothetical protein
MGNGRILKDSFRNGNKVKMTYWKAKKLSDYEKLEHRRIVRITV